LPDLPLFPYTTLFRSEIAGSITTYNGALLPFYRDAFLKYISVNYNVKDLVIENETINGELYIDTLSVYPRFQGKGIGSKLLLARSEEHTSELQSRENL